MGRLKAWLPWKLKRRHRKQLAVAAELLVGTAMSGLMAWVVVLLLQRVMQVGWLVGGWFAPAQQERAAHNCAAASPVACQHYQCLITGCRCQQYPARYAVIDSSASAC
jgi:hypothetical protein